MSASQGLFLYFLSGWDRDTTTREKLLTAPFAALMFDALRNERSFSDMVVTHNVATGPSGSSGVLLVVRHPAWPDTHRIGYYPDEQTWREVAPASGGCQPSESYWLGYVTSCKPGPDSLQRETLVSGYDYELGDERIWHAPIIRYPAGNANLPQTMGVDGSGKFVESVVASMTWAWTLACDIWDRFVMGDGLQRPEIFDAAVKSLGVNYRVGQHECSTLGLLDGPKAKLILQAAIAGPMIDELMGEDAKKNQPASP